MGSARGWQEGWRRSRTALPTCLLVLSLVLLSLDRVVRFYLGDSAAYLSTGLNGWIPPDRSWAYGFLGRWLLEWTRSIVALPLAQAIGFALSLLILQRCLARHAGRLAVPAWIPCVLVLDPLNQTYARFWLSDVPAAALFLCFLACVPPGRGTRPVIAILVPLLLALGLTFARVAYVPIVLSMLFMLLASSFRSGLPGLPALRRRLAVLCLLPVLSLGVLAVANSQVSIQRLHGHVFVNRMSGLYTMGVLLPGLRRADFLSAGIAISDPEFAALHLEDYDRRENAVWGDGPTFVRWLMQDRLHHPDLYDAGFQQRCRSVVRSALLHHPQTLVTTYLWSLVLYLSPAEWRRVERAEMGTDKLLPEWMAGYLSFRSGALVRTDITRTPSLMPQILRATITAYPILLIVGSLCSIGLLLRRRAFDAGHVLAGAMLASLVLAPLYSHAVKPRYVLASVTLSEWIIAIVLVTAWRGVASGGAGRSRSHGIAIVGDHDSHLQARTQGDGACQAG